jgi:hypothetical protein
MNRTQQYLLTMLDRLPVWELSGDDPRSVMDRLKDRLASVEDVQPEIRRLFRVRGFSDFALGLLWISDKVERDPARVESTVEEERFLFSLFRRAMASTGAVSSAPPAPASPPEPEPGFFPEPSPEPEPAPPPVDEAPAAADPDFPAPSPPPHAEGGDHPERQFSGVLERFVEALQNASEDRPDQLKDVIAKCDAMAATEGAADDLKQFTFLLQEFLHYISDNQLLDDVRVMNIVANAQEPFSQWARFEDAERAGMLDQAIEILRDSKAMFE